MFEKVNIPIILPAALVKGIDLRLYSLLLIQTSNLCLNFLKSFYKKLVIFRVISSAFTELQIHCH